VQTEKKGKKLAEKRAKEAGAKRKKAKEAAAKAASEAFSKVKKAVKPMVVKKPVKKPVPLKKKHKMKFCKQIEAFQPFLSKAPKLKTWRYRLITWAQGHCWCWPLLGCSNTKKAHLEAGKKPKSDAWYKAHDAMLVTYVKLFSCLSEELHEQDPTNRVSFANAVTACDVKPGAQTRAGQKVWNAMKVWIKKLNSKFG